MQLQARRWPTKTLTPIAVRDKIPTTSTARGVMLWCFCRPSACNCIGGNTDHNVINRSGHQTSEHTNMQLFAPAGSRDYLIEANRLRVGESSAEASSVNCIVAYYEIASEWGNLLINMHMLSQRLFSSRCNALSLTINQRERFSRGVDKHAHKTHTKT